MLPTLGGRIQTRIFAVAVFGGLWTLLITLILPTGAPLGESYKATFTILLMVIVLGVLWEFVYHFLMQFRWEKDWPTLFGLITAINEGLLIWFMLANGWWFWDVSVPGPAFLIHFITTWLVVWAMVNGPMRVPFIHWRFHGGALIP